MARSLASVRLDESATCRYVLFIAGEPAAYTNDESGGLHGDGLDSWAGLSETAIGGNEVFGTRVVRGGLILPDSVSFEIDLKSGALQPSPATFQILDVDVTLGALFADEGKDFDILYEHVAAGTTALGTSVQIYPGGGATTNPRGKYIDAERIGPSGQRAFLPAIPFDLVGGEYHASPDLPPSKISSSPIVFAGRLVTLYRIYKLRPELEDSDPTAWATWDQAHAAGDLVWWGVLQDAGNIGANDVWSLDCHGPDGLTRKTLGTVSAPNRWMRINADLTLTADEKLVAIGFSSTAGNLAGTTNPGQRTFYNGNYFHHSVTAATRSELAAEIDGWINDARNGTDDPDVESGGVFANGTDGDGSTQDPDAGVEADGTIWIRRNERVSDDVEYCSLWLAMHADVWRRLGFEPERQGVGNVQLDDLTQVEFRKLASGEQLHFKGELTGVNVPADGFWLGHFTTRAIGTEPDGISSVNGFDNDGQPRIYEPMHTAEVFVLTPGPRQTIRLVDEEQDKLYLQGQPEAAIIAEGVTVDGTAVTLSRWFVLRGELAISSVITELGEEMGLGPAGSIEVHGSQKIHCPVKVEWAQGTNYGQVSIGTTGGDPSLKIVRWEDPRAWGWNNLVPGEGWAGKIEGKGTIEIAPLHAYHHRPQLKTKPFELAGSIWMQIMLSTGSSTGYTDTLESGGVFVLGENPAPLYAVLDEWGADVCLADMGLGIPSQLVAADSTTFDAFDAVPGEYAGDLNRQRIGIVGPYQAADLLDSLMRPRRLYWSLNGKKFGVFQLGPVSPESVDLDVGEADLYGPANEPTSVIPSQTLRATGQLDRVDLAYRWDADEKKQALSFSVPAMDAGARGRTGELVEQVKDYGLCPPWFGDDQEAKTGVGPWFQLFRDFWGKSAAEFLARRHFAVEFTLSRPKGQDAMPGTSIRFTNPWPINASGTRGLSNRTGRIVRVTQNLRDHSAHCEAIVFAGENVYHYGPIVRLRRVTGTTVEWYPDHLGHNDPDVVDGVGFEQPDWLTNPAHGSGVTEAWLFQRSGTTWTLVDTKTISTVDLVARTAVLASTPSNVLRDRDCYMVIGGVTNGTPLWAQDVYGVQVDQDLTIGDAATKAPPFAG